MEISLWGPKSLYIKGKAVKIWLDPKKEDLDKESKVIIFEKHEDNFLGLNTGDKVAIWGPGEYEVSGVEIYCAKTGSGIMSIMQFDDIKLGWISTDKIDLTDKKKERLAECDVLMIKSCGQIKDIWELVKGMGINYLIMTDLNETLKLEKSTLPEVMEVVILQQK